MSAACPTPSQTVGPFHHFALPFAGGGDSSPPGDPGAVRIAGTVYDGAGEPVHDALVEVWQANRSGRYHAPRRRPRDLPLDAKASPASAAARRPPTARTSS